MLFILMSGSKSVGDLVPKVQAFWTLSFYFPAHITMYIPINDYYSEQ